IVWGSSTKLLSQDKDLQEWIKKMKKIGIELYACKWCSDSYGVSELLEKLGITVNYYGKPLSKMIKDNWNILTF
ncbi:MAG: DsrE family protein, partial [bacterium]|nr:DsrE family protein [bacterium]